MEFINYSFQNFGQSGKTKTIRGIILTIWTLSQLRLFQSFRKNFLQHDKAIHEGRTPHKCLICDYSCARKDQLKGHINTVHERMKPHKCSSCEYSCVTNSHLKIHINSVHEGKKPHKCTICDQSFLLMNPIENS